MGPQAQGGREKKGGEGGEVAHSSEFKVHRSQFTVHDLRFTIRNSRFTIRREREGEGGRKVGREELTVQ